MPWFILLGIGLYATYLVRRYGFAFGTVVLALVAICNFALRDEIHFTIVKTPPVKIQRSFIGWIQSITMVPRVATDGAVIVQLPLASSLHQSFTR